jgi:hypothetical protein
LGVIVTSEHLVSVVSRKVGNTALGLAGAFAFFKSKVQPLLNLATFCKRAPQFHGNKIHRLLAK